MTNTTLRKAPKHGKLVIGVVLFITFVLIVLSTLFSSLQAIIIAVVTIFATAVCTIGIVYGQEEIRDILSNASIGGFAKVGDICIAGIQGCDKPVALVFSECDCLYRYLTVSTPDADSLQQGYGRTGPDQVLSSFGVCYC
jgi:hypothetical protein